MIFVVPANQELQSPGGPEYHFRATVLAIGGPEYTTEGAFVVISWDIGHDNHLILTSIGDRSYRMVDRCNKTCFKVVNLYKKVN